MCSNFNSINDRNSKTYIMKTHAVIISGIHSGVDKIGLAKEIQEQLGDNCTYKYSWV